MVVMRIMEIKFKKATSVALKYPMIFASLSRSLRSTTT